MFTAKNFCTLSCVEIGTKKERKNTIGDCQTQLLKPLLKPKIYMGIPILSPYIFGVYLFWNLLALFLRHVSTFLTSQLLGHFFAFLPWLFFAVFFWHSSGKLLWHFFTFLFGHLSALLLATVPFCLKRDHS